MKHNTGITIKEFLKQIGDVSVMQFINENWKKWNFCYNLDKGIFGSGKDRSGWAKAGDRWVAVDSYAITENGTIAIWTDREPAQGYKR